MQMSPVVFAFCTPQHLGARLHEHVRVGGKIWKQERKERVSFEGKRDLKKKEETRKRVSGKERRKRGERKRERKKGGRRGRKGKKGREKGRGEKGRTWGNLGKIRKENSKINERQKRE